MYKPIRAGVVQDQLIYKSTAHLQTTG